MGKLDGKVAFITGAARGQGRSHAVLLASEGADIIGIDICDQVDSVAYPMSTPEDLAETVSQVEKLDRRMVAVKCDVRDRAGLQAAVQQGVSELGRLDIVCANAGVMDMQPAPYTKSEQAWRDSLDIMLTGVWNTLQVTVPILIEQNQGGAIVITSSTAGTRVVTTNFDGGYDGYNAAKHGVVALMRSYAGRLARHSIRVNSVHPTACATPMVENEFFGEWAMSEPEIMAAYTNALPVPMIEAIDISRAVLYLTSEDGRYITGHTLMVDAGMTSVSSGAANTALEFG
ncbi:MAG: mycofactocin-coupled SDR family oxidoreductase [Acidimicrobiia bacterium]